MRTITTGQRNYVSASALTIRAKVEITDPDGTWRDVSTALNGVDWLNSVELTESIDSTSQSFSLSLLRDTGTLSLAPLREDSLVNRNAVNAYAPMLDLRRKWRVSVDVEPTGYKEIGTGYIDTIEIGDRAEIRVTGRDLAAPLLDAYIRTKRTYGDVTGVAMETVIQQLLNDNQADNGYSAVTLYTPVSPNFLMNPWEQQEGSVMQAINDIAARAGYVVRYRYDAADLSRLTLFKPDRTASTAGWPVVPDPTRWTIGPTEYLALPVNRLDLSAVRNLIVLRYVDLDGVTQTVQSPASGTSSSITKYGIRSMFIDLAATSQVNTGERASAMAAAIQSDLETPAFEQQFESYGLWFVQQADYIKCLANGVHYNTDQYGGVVGITHSIGAGTMRTVVSLKGKPAGRYRTWLLEGGATEPVDGQSQPPYLIDFRVVLEDDTTRTYSWLRPDPKVVVWAASKQYTTPVTADMWVDLAARVVPLGLDEFRVMKPVIENTTVLVHVEARFTSEPTEHVWRGQVEPTPSQAPVYAHDDIETDVVGIRWLSIQSRGIAWVRVFAQVQYGDGTYSPWLPPLRGPGAMSAVKGVTLGAAQYEHEVPLHPTRSAFIGWMVELATGQMVVVDWLGFDRDKRPNILSVEKDKATLFVVGDSDTKSVRLSRIFTVTMTATAAIGATALTVSGLPWKFPVGTLVNFNGTIVRVRVEAIGGATSLPIGSTTGVIIAAATANGYTRRVGGSFITDGFRVGEQITPVGFASNPVSIITAVADLSITVADARNAESESTGRSLASALGVAIPNGTWAYDIDLSSIAVGPAWERWVDGPSTPSGGVDVAQTGTNGAVGVVAGVQWAIRIEAYAAPKGEVIAKTLKARAPVDALVQWTTPVDPNNPGPTEGTGGGGGAGTSPPTGGGGGTPLSWTIVSAKSPNTLNEIITLSLQASAAPAGHTARVRLTIEQDGVITDNGFITDLLSPVLSAPPTALTSYTYTGALHTEYVPEKRYTFTAEIVNAVGLMVASQSATATYRTGNEPRWGPGTGPEIF